MREHRYSDAAFAAKVTAALPAGKKVSASAVTKWRLGSSVPRRETIIVVENLTDGGVTAASFVHAEGP